MGAYQLKIIVKGSKPPVWRRILAPENSSFGQLHQIIRTAFCWNDDLPYQFEFREKAVQTSSDCIDALVSGTKKFNYTYGGDSCKLEIQVEEPAEDYNEGYARVIKYKGNSEDYDMDAVNQRLSRGQAIDTAPAEKIPDTRLRKIEEYFRAANFLYINTPPSVILETFNKYEEKKLTLEELMQAYERLHAGHPIVKYADGSFADVSLLGQNRFADLCRLQKKGPYYIPTKQEIRIMAGDRGILMTEELSRLGSFLTGRLRLSDKKLSDLLYQIQEEIRLGGTRTEVMAVLGKAGISFESEEQEKTLLSLLNEVWNQTRQVVNRGHKPHEMILKGLEEGKNQRRNGRKIYPNSPCPCGSGKKYKKCCGR